MPPLTDEEAKRNAGARQRKRPKSVWALLLGIPALLLLALYALREAGWQEQFHSLPAPVVWEEVIGAPVPSGVTNLRVAARAYVIKSWVWMSFNATDEVMNSLRGEQEPYDPARAKDVLRGQGWASHHRHNVEDRKAVGWERVLAIKEPEIYEVGWNASRRSSRRYLWVGHLIVDRQNHMVYIHAGGD